jgi:ABC-type nitrate/sulfonate/bicarbonate transport system permease component
MSDRPLSRSGALLRSLISVVVLLAAWEWVGRAGIFPAILLPPFTAVTVQLWQSIADFTLFSDMAISLMRAFVGLTLAGTVGILLGLTMSRSRFVNWLFDPVVSLAFPSPKIAFLPIFVLWFGIDSLSKVLLVAFACVFPVIIGTYSAARAVSRIYFWSAASLGTGGGRMLWKIIFPACLPRIFSTLRVALPVALITTFTAEMVAGGGGMGATLVYSQRFFESQVVYAYILVMLTVGLALDAATTAAQRRFLSWAD